MIILRYLSRELLQTALAVAIVLLVIVTVGRFIKYLAEAAAGKLDVDIVLLVMVYRIPGFLELILPLSFFIGLLLAYGRLYTDSEMTVLHACGISRRRILAYTCVPAGLLTIIVASLSVWLSPIGLQKARALLEAQKARSDFAIIQPARFQKILQGDAVSYAQSLSDDNKLQHVFMAKSAVDDDKLAVVRAETAQYIDNKEYGQRYWVLGNGVHYQGRPGLADYRVTRFSVYGHHIPQPDLPGKNLKKVDMLPTYALLQSSDIAHTAAWQWRFSIPLLMLVVMLIGVPLSETSPRRGRYIKLFPAILLYLIYLVLLNAAKKAVEEGQVPAGLGLWWVHAVFLLVALVLWIDKRLWINRFGLG